MRKYNRNKICWSVALGNILGTVCIWLISAWLIFKGYAVLANHFSTLPTFTYKEVLFLRMAFSMVMKIFWQRSEHLTEK